jgi:mono/diheme cytochrome c family protein
MMNRKSLLTIATGISLMISSCSSDKQQGNESGQGESANLMKDSETAKNNEKGIGKFTDVQLTHPLDEALLAKGQSIYASKCIACHKLTDEKLVGPGWKGVTDRRTPEWTLNFITNTNAMLDSDAVAKELIEKCLVRMPNQSLNDDEARAVFEFMRKNDGKN